MLSEADAKKYVIKTILTGDKKRIKEVTERFNKVYGKSRSNGTEESIRPETTFDPAGFAEEIGLTEKTE